jgi:hypothetical protein
MYRAKVLLRGSELSLMEIAERVSYETDTALSRAFRRSEGIAPGEWRRNGPDRSATERQAAASDRCSGRRIARAEAIDALCIDRLAATDEECV